MRLRTSATALFSLIALLAAGCARESRHAELPSVDAPVVLFFGDSITSGQGVAEAETFVALLQERMREAGVDYRCINGGVSGDTTASALARLQPYVDAHPALVVIELGANDAFRGVSRVRTRDNLIRIARAFQQAGAKVVIAGAQFPHVFHPALGLSLARTYEQVARETGAVLVADLLADVAGDRRFNIEDGIHPNAAGHARIADALWPVLAPLL